MRQRKHRRKTPGLRPSRTAKPARRAAQARPADRRVFTLDRKSWEAFTAALEAPPCRHPRLALLFPEPSVFDSENGF